MSTSSESHSAFSPVKGQLASSDEAVAVFSRVPGNFSSLPFWHGRVSPTSSYGSSLSYLPHQSFPPWRMMCQGLACCNPAPVEGHPFAVNANLWPAAMSYLDGYCTFQPRSSVADGSRSFEKPTQSYVGLIGRAILGSPEKKLILSDIYSYILINYPYFQNKGTGWRNSIRHNLSLNDCFIKAGRSPNGKGHFWAINPLYYQEFVNGDYKPRRMNRLSTARSSAIPYKYPTTFSRKAEVPDRGICKEERLLKYSNLEETKLNGETKDNMFELKQVQKSKLDRFYEQELKEMKETDKEKAVIKSFDVCNLLRIPNDKEFARQKTTSKDSKDIS